VMIAYALAKINFKGRKKVDGFIMFQMFFPTMILLIPQFLVVKNLHFYNTYAAMIIPKALSLWAVFLYTNFFKALPDE
ncbi:ABC transporter permease, partial [Eggerthella lenta]|nr:ABC transporter permease [Eggerthella lenta]